MKKLTIRLLAVMTAVIVLMAGCSEQTNDASKTKGDSSSSSQSDSSSVQDSAAETTQGVDDAGISDVIPWDGDGDPMGLPAEGSASSADSDSSSDNGESSSQTTKETAATTKNGDSETLKSTAAATRAVTTKAATAKTTAKTTAKATTTTKKAVTTAPAPAVTSGTPVQKHGALKISGNHIVDSHGKAFMLQGMSTHGIMWESFSDILSVNSLKVLRDDWKCNAVRIAMYTAEWGGYTTGSSYAAQAKQKVINGVANATKLGMYVIIDWHILSDNNPQTHQAQAVAFFKEMAQRYKNYNNVIYEICNEPNGGVTWSANIKPYCQAVVNAIRSIDKNKIIICGTGTWSQDIDQVLGNRINDANCAYTLHFYANTHTDWLRQRLQSCYNSGLPVLVTEFGTCDASGNGGFNDGQTRQWYNLLKSLKVGWFNWSASNKAETASAFLPGTNLASIKAGESQLTQSGKLIRSLFRANAANT